LVCFCEDCLFSAFGDLSPICLSFLFYPLSAVQISRLFKEYKVPTGTVILLLKIPHTPNGASFFGVQPGSSGTYRV
jgi:hypothetical protein